MKKTFALLMALLVCVCLLTLAVTALDGDTLPAAEQPASETDADPTPEPTPTDAASETDADPTPEPTSSPEPTPEPTPVRDLSVDFAPDGKSAVVAGDWDGLYARVALIIDNGGLTGLYVTQCVINDSGIIVMPAFLVPGLTVKGVNVALVAEISDIASPTPRVVASGFMYL